jgi:hypothetical protein
MIRAVPARSDEPTATPAPSTDAVGWFTDAELADLWLADVAERVISVARSRDGARPD